MNLKAQNQAYKPQKKHLKLEKKILKADIGSRNSDMFEIYKPHSLNLTLF